MAQLPTPSDPNKRGEYVPLYRAADEIGIHYDQLKKMVDDGKLDHIVSGFCSIHRNDVKRLREEGELQRRLTQESERVAPRLCQKKEFRDLVLAWQVLNSEIKAKIAKLILPTSA